MEFIGVSLNWRRIGIATILYRVQGNWLCCILNKIDFFFKHRNTFIVCNITDAVDLHPFISSEI